MLNAIIIEDEKNGQEALVSLLEMYCPQVKITGIADGVKTGVQLILTNKPDLVFLDIILGKENGFDLLEKLQPIFFQIIFTTSSDGYALKAFKANAIDYLMKPVEPNRLVKAVDKVQKMKGTEVMQERFTHLLNSLQNQRIERISIASRKDGIAIIELNKIIYIQGSGTYSTFHLDDDPNIMASNNLGYFHTLLPENLFYRVHQSYLVNIKYIKRVLPREGVLELSNGTQIPVAKGRRDGLLDALM